MIVNGPRKIMLRAKGDGEQVGEAGTKSKGLGHIYSTSSR